MIIRRLTSVQQLITQPAHAALAARIMQHWQSGLADSPRRASILRAIERHDDGWADVDETLIVDTVTGRLVDFVEVSDQMKRETSSRGIESLSSDPYAAALVAQHRLHVYRRYAGHPEWTAFFAQITAARDSYLAACGSGGLDQLVRDYALVRAGDLASLAFCNSWTTMAAEECGHAMRLEGTTLSVAPDPFGGQTIGIEIAARQIGIQAFASAAEAREAVASAPVVTLKGLVTGIAT